MPTSRSAATAAATAAATLLSLFAVFSAADFPGNISSRRPQHNLSLCEELIRPSGYHCSEHTVQTKDGHLLGLQRVWSGPENLTSEPRPPVLLQHGLFMGGDAWFLNSNNQSLGFILADHGFDIWIGNVRGTRWSHGHVSLSEKDKEEKKKLKERHSPSMLLSVSSRSAGSTFSSDSLFDHNGEIQVLEFKIYR